MKASVLVVDDDRILRRALNDRFRLWGHVVAEAANGEDALLLAAKGSYDVVLLDLAMPGLSGLDTLSRLRSQGCESEIVVLTAHGSVEKAVEAMKRGADDFLVKPADFELLKKAVERALEKRALRRVNRVLTDQRNANVLPIVGESESMKRLYETARRAANSEASILLLGESGTGKQVLAEMIHRKSPRATGPFVYINCVAISDELIESTLFGHEKGAFTGAAARKEGRLETATGGTAFLDEVGDISPKLQTKMLHFLESGEFERVGGTQSLTVDCRIIAATNRDLSRAVREGRFREDLFYRLNVVTLDIPPLRERPEDIPVLANAFLDRLRRELKRDALYLADEALQVLRRYSWPGNVRQLKNAIERMAVLATSDELGVDLLPPEIQTLADHTEESLPDLPYREAMDRFKIRLLKRALHRAGGNQTRAAELLGIQRTYLNRLVHELDVRSEE